MKFRIQFALAVACVLALGVGASVVSDASANGKLSYAEEIVASNLVVTFDEGGQRRFVAVDYRLDATVSVVRFCNGQGLGQQYLASDTVTVAMPKGHAVGTLTLEGPGTVVCSCGCSQGTLTIDYTDVTLTNLTAGDVYRLDPISQTYST